MTERRVAGRPDTGQRGAGQNRPPKKRTRAEAASDRRQKLETWRESGGLDELKSAAAKRATPRYAWEEIVKSPAGPPDMGTRAVLIFLADKCHDDRVVACPSVIQLADELVITETTVRHHLKLAVEGCWLTRTRFVKKFGTYEWQLTLAPSLHDLLPPKFAAKVRRGSVVPVTREDLGGQGDDLGGQERSPEDTAGEPLEEARTPIYGGLTPPTVGGLGRQPLAAPPPTVGDERYATSLSGGFAEGDRPVAGASPDPVPGGSPPPPDPGSQAEARGTGGRSVSGGWLRAVRLPLVVVVPDKNHDNVRRRLATRCEAEQHDVPRASPDKARGPGGRFGPPGALERATPGESADTPDRQAEAEMAERRASSESAARQVHRDLDGTQLRGRVSGRPGSSSPGEASVRELLPHMAWPAAVNEELAAIAREHDVPMLEVHNAMLAHRTSLSLPDPTPAMTPAEARGRWAYSRLSDRDVRALRTRSLIQAQRHGCADRWAEFAIEECARSSPQNAFEARRAVIASCRPDAREVFRRELEARDRRFPMFEPIEVEADLLADLFVLARELGISAPTRDTSAAELELRIALAAKTPEERQQLVEAAARDRCGRETLEDVVLALLHREGGHRVLLSATSETRQARQA